MKFLIPFFIGLLSSTANAQIFGPLGPISGGLEIPSDGLGDAAPGQIPGIAAQDWPWFMNGENHIFLYTGDAPEPYGSFTITLDPVQFPLKANGNHPHPICVATPAWTNPDYAAGYAIPRWPNVTIQQDEYNLKQNTVSFRWLAGVWLQPRSAYSVNIVCPPKTNLAGQ